MTDRKKILITGATGFLGSHLTKSVLKNTDYEIVLLKRSFSNTFRINEELANPKVKYYDVDKADLSKIFEENEIGIIIHCATEYDRENSSCSKVLETNLMFPIKLLEMAEEYNVETFINTDSYFNKDNMSYSFLLNYSLSKKSLNLWLKYFSKKIKIINMVLEHVYGENDNENKFVEFAIRQIAIDGIDKLDLTAGQQKRDFIYIEDVCNAYIRAIQYSQDNSFRLKQFDIGTGVATSLLNFVKLIKELSQSETILNFGAINYRDDEIMYSCADIIELKALNLQKFKTVQEGLEKIIKIYRKELKCQ